MTNAERQRQYRQRRKGRQETKKARSACSRGFEDHKRAMEKLRAWNLKTYRHLSDEQQGELDKIIFALAGTEAAFQTIA